MNKIDNPIKIHDFHGGVHPPENKTQTCHKGIKQAAIPRELVLPLQQHIGAAAKPIVQVNDYVLKGQKIAEANGYVSVPLHAPTSGKIIAIEERPVQHPSGFHANAIVIEPDGNDSWCERKAIPNFKRLDKNALIQAIRDAGIAGMGGAGFPSPVKLSIRATQKIDTLILNSVECEPYITADDVLIREHANEILVGLEIINGILQAERILIGIEDNKPEAIAAYKKAIDESTLNNVFLAVVPTRYPSGGEKQLIQLLTGKEVPAGALPADIGIVCQNTGTVHAIHDAIIKGEPLISRITTVTGAALAEPQNYRTLIGTPFRFLLDSAGIHWKQLSHLVMGGPMMGFAVSNPQVPVVKTTNCILAGAKGELLDPEMEQPCIRCGACAEVCPANLLPQQLYWYSKSKELEKVELYHIADCIECGACSYVCPSNIPLVQYYRFSKGEIRIKNIEHKKSELSRERFEARKARLEREEQEKETKRLAKLQERQQKKLESNAQANAEVTNAETTNVSDKLEAEFTAAKTRMASASKLWKEAEKALLVAEKNGEANIETLRAQVNQLQQDAESAQAAFKKLADEKKQRKSETPVNPINNSEQMNNLKIEQATLKAQLKKLQKALDESDDDNTQSELNRLLQEAQKKLQQCSEALSAITEQHKTE